MSSDNLEIVDDGANEREETITVTKKSAKQTLKDEARAQRKAHEEQLALKMKNARRQDMMAADEFASQEEVLLLIKESWNEICKEPDDREKGVVSKEEEEKETIMMAQRNARQTAAQATQGGAQQAKKSGGWFGTGKSKDVSLAVKEGEEDQKDTKKASSMSTWDIPRTFDEMVRLNAGMIGANLQYINIMLDSFGGLVADVCKRGHLQEQTDIVCMRLAKEVKGSIKVNEFKICLLASMRALIPGMWNVKLEKAWVWLWVSIEVHLRESLPFPNKYGKIVAKFVEGLEDNVRSDIGMCVWKRVFVEDPSAENFFRQSNQRLIYIVTMAIKYSVEFYGDPEKTKMAIEALALKHIMYQVQPRMFMLFVTCYDEEIKARTDDKLVQSGMHWSISIIASIMARVVEDGANPILTAALANDVKTLKMELGKVARGDRANSMLNC